jgi:hypothetical protein
VQVKIRIGNKTGHHCSHDTSTVSKQKTELVKGEDEDDALDRQKPKLIQSNSCFSSQSSFLEDLDQNQ